MTRLKHVPEGTVDMLGPGTPPDGYIREKLHSIGAAGIVAFVGGLAVGLGYTIVHPEYADRLAQAAHDRWVNSVD